ncbi:facilitated trehalose transporter Tret1 [Anoplophora glabripennis]|uniref:facilitated trehalose transporter Tret1 n=1 Tax=Anoplophora glabripennis TaxID=217634 RepID=UPI000874D773|nr:facilitated trehalose transporter Tret1 [Anoplophora glabripennis]
MFLKHPISFTLVSVLTVNLLATTGDITLSWTSPIYPKLYSNDSSINPLGRPITEDEDGWLGSLLTLGAIVGPFPYSVVASRFGRKIGLLAIAIPHIVSYFTLAFARTIYLFYFARVFGGLAMGAGYSLLPMYIAEVSEVANRGMMSLTLNVFWAIGNFIPYAIGPFISIMWFNIILACIPTAFFIIFVIIGVETPYFLAEKNKTDKAEKSLMKLRSLEKQGVQKELEDIKAHLKKDEDGHLTDILKRPELRKAFIICLVLIIAQELSGFCAITFYLQPIFEAAGTPISSEMSALYVGISMLVSSFISPFLVDRLGRRILIIGSCCGMCVALAMIGAFFYVQDATDNSTDSITWIPIFSLIFYITSFNFGMSSVPWTLCSEMFPSNVKQIAASCVSSTCWITTFLVTRFFNDMNDGLGRFGSFWFFSASCLVAAVFSVVMVPETKGKSFSDIQDMLRYGSIKKSGDNIVHEVKVWPDENGIK